MCDRRNRGDCGCGGGTGGVFGEGGFGAGFDRDSDRSVVYSARSGLRDVLLSELQGASGLLIQFPFRS